MRMPSQQPPHTTLSTLARHGPLLCLQPFWLFRGDKNPSDEAPQASIPVTALKINTFALFRVTSPGRTRFCLLS